MILHTPNSEKLTLITWCWQINFTVPQLQRSKSTRFSAQFNHKNQHYTAPPAPKFNNLLMLHSSNVFGHCTQAVRALSISPVQTVVLIWPVFSSSPGPNRPEKSYQKVVFCWVSFFNWLKKTPGKWYWTKDGASLQLLMAAYHQISVVLTSNHPQESSLQSSWTTI